MVSDKVAEPTPELTTEEREEYRTLLIGEKAQDAMEFQEWACLEFGPAAGILCRELLFWDNRGVDGEGWIYKTEEELTRKGLSRHFQRKARATLIRRGVLEEEKRGIPCQLWYRLRLESLMEVRFPQDAADTPEPVETPTNHDLCDECGCVRDGCFCSFEEPETDIEPEEDGYEDDVHEYTNADEPEPEPETEWLPDDYGPKSQTLNLHYSPTRKGVEQVRHARESDSTERTAERTSESQSYRQQSVAFGSSCNTG